MRNRKPTKRRRRVIVVILLGVTAVVGLWSATAWHIETAADFFAACAVSCFVFSVLLLLGPVSNAPRIDVDHAVAEASEAFRIHAPGVCQSEVIFEDLGSEMDADDIGGDFAEGGFDCDFDIPFF